MKTDFCVMVSLDIMK